MCGHEMSSGEHVGESTCFFKHTKNLFVSPAASVPDSGERHRWWFQQQVRELQTKQGRCQLGSGCFKHQCLAVGYKVILNGFITDSLCQSAFSGTWSYLIHTFFAAHSLTHLWDLCGLTIKFTHIVKLFLSGCCFPNGKKVLYATVSCCCFLFCFLSRATLLIKSKNNTKLLKP